MAHSVFDIEKEAALPSPSPLVNDESKEHSLSEKTNYHSTTSYIPSTRDNEEHDGSTHLSDKDDIHRIRSRSTIGDLPARQKSHASEAGRTASNVLAHVASRITTRDWSEPPPPPNGGMKAWTQVGMGWLCVFCTWGYLNSYGAFQTYYQTTMLPELEPSTISWIGSLQTFLTLIVGALSGRLLDAGLYVPTFIVGAFLQTLGIFLMSISTKYWQLMLTQGILTGIGGGIYFTPSLALVTTYFSSRRGIAMGLLTTGNSAGGMVYPVIVRQLFPVLGFAWTARVLAFMNLAFLTIVAFFMRPRLPPRKSGSLVDWDAFRDRVFVSLVLGLFTASLAHYFTFYYIASFGTTELKLSYTAASTLVIIINGAGLPFRIIPPLIADRVGPLTVVVVITICWTVVTFSWLAVHSISGYYAFAICFGACAGSFQCLMPTSVASITDQLDRVGTRLGMAFGLVAFAALTGGPIGGAIMTKMGGDYCGAQTFAGCCTAIGCFFCICTRVWKGGWSFKVWA